MSPSFQTKDISQESFLVTGGAGIIGSHIAVYLLRNGAKKVRVLDNLVNGFQTNLDLLRSYSSFEFMEGDIRNEDTCAKACRDMKYVSHQAAVGSVPRSIKEPVYFNEVNVGGFVNMLKAASDNKVKQFVYASSSSVYGDEPNLPKIEDRVGNCLSPYAATKKTNELYANVFANVYGLNLLGFRYFNIFGPRQNPDGDYAAVIPLFIKCILNETPIYINGDGEQTRDFTPVENAVQANILGMLTDNKEALNKVYNIAMGENFSVNYLFNTCKKYLQSNFEVSYRESRAGDIKNSLADISLAKNLLGYSPTKKFEQGLIETIDFFKEKHS
jgi:UDP-N-acetylglucosamine 4-epimerase